LYLAARYWSELPYRGVVILSLAVIFLHSLCVAGYPNWWGGGSYGPRLTTDLLPWFALIAIVGWAGATETRGLLAIKSELVTALVLLAISVAINGRGAFSAPTQQWSTIVDVDGHPERIFDWSHPQFAAGLVTPPDYVIENTNRLKQIALSRAKAK
jgi:hypothetical protein